MTEFKLPIMWNEQVVGYVVSPKVDHFFLYGRWLPAPEGDSQAFLLALERGEQLKIVIGSDQPRIRATIEERPDQFIEMVITAQ
jgi:hypothetical protein